MPAPVDRQNTKKSRQVALAAAREEQRRLRAEQLRRDQQRRRLIRIGVPVLVVVLVVAVFVVVKLLQPAPKPSTPTTALSATAAADIAAVPASAFAAVGAGTAKAPGKVTGTALTADGKPRVLYIGAEYCPYCAAERWGVAVALSRFGSFSNLGATTSSASDVYPSTATLSFHGATYTSSIVSFTGVEETNNQKQPLDTPTVADQALFSQYNQGGSIPFLDIGNAWVTVGATFLPDALQGLTQDQIAAQLKDPTTAVAKDVLGAANSITAAICTQTGNSPAAVCSSAGVTAAAAVLTGAGAPSAAPSS